MAIILFILLGIGCEIVMANEWFVIPYYIPFILFGIAGFMLFINIVSWFLARRRIKNMEKGFDRMWKIW